MNRKKNGDFYWESASVSPIFDSNQKIVNYLKVSEDITVAKKASDDLKIALNEVQLLKDKIQNENYYLQDEIKQVHNFSEIVGQSEVVSLMFEQISLVSKTNTAVLILGETGTGKELVARAIHNRSDRSNKPLVKINCSALPAELIESELFGHVKGAFTGALAKKMGRFELANGGTIFLDEIGDLPLGLQAKLLRVLQEQEFEPVGSSTTIKVDVRLIAATNRDLDKLVSEGEFRQDLFYRLNVFPITCPPLNRRIEDIPLLVHHFIKKFERNMGKKIKSVPKKVIENLKRYNWPGNVRELENIIERAMVINQGDSLAIGDWFVEKKNQDKETFSSSLIDVEKEHILSVLEKVNWRIRGENGAAAILEMKPTTLESKMKKLGIKR